MKFTHIFIGTITLIAVASACDDTVTTLGSSLVTDNSEVVIDSAYEVTGLSIRNTDIQSRTVTQLLGTLDAKEYGNFSSEIVTQFMPSLKIDTTGVSVNDIDSIKMYMFMKKGDFTGDSLVPMGMKIYPLIKQLPTPIYSDFNPDGYYDEADCWTPQSQIYTANALSNDSLDALSYRAISVKLPISFAKSFYQEYLNHPETFATPMAFAQYFPGIYIKNSFGSGRVININQTRINLYYRRHATVTLNDNTTRDTIYNLASTYMAVTPEVVTNNIIKLKLSQHLTDMADAGNSILVAPAGYDVRLEFPTNEILSRYKSHGDDMTVINTLSFSVPVLDITNNYNIKPPTYVLLVLSKDKNEFFANNKLSDDKTSFLATYDAENKCYDFTNMRQYILDMLAKDNITADDYTFTITPVDILTETSSSGYYSSGQAYTTAINPYVSGPAMCTLDLKNAKIKFTYSKQSINN